MTASSEIPKYRVLTDTFISPRMIAAGSIITTHGSPGAHLQPLNPEADAKMEAWYDEEFPVAGPDGKTVIGPDGKLVMYKPHERFRIRTYEPGEVHAVNVVAEPPPLDMTNSMSLAQVDQRVNTDQRPGPAMTVQAGEKPAAEVLTEGAPPPERKNLVVK